MDEIQIKNFSWSFTNKCNLRCLHCIIDSGEEKNKELTTQEAKNVINQLYELNCGCIHFTGGECLTKPNFLEIAQYCKDKGLKATLVTNATLVNENNIDIIKNIFNDVRVSLNGSSEESHDKIRGNGNFAKTIKAIKLLNRAHISIIFFITLGNINMNEMTNIIKLCHKYNAIGLKIDSIVLEGRALNHEDIFKLDDDQIQWLVQEFRNNFDGDLTEDDVCNISNESLYLTADGDVYPCVHLALHNRVKYLLGNVRDVSVESMIRKLNKEIYPKCQNKKCVHKFYSKGENYVLGTRNPNNKVCLC